MNANSNKQTLAENLHVIEKEECIFCALERSIKNNYWVCDLEFGTVYINFNQSFYGRILYVPFQHFVHLKDVPKDILVEFIIEVQFLADVIQTGFKANLMNIASLGNIVSHLHWHIIPRYKNDQKWGLPPWPNKKIVLSEYEIENLRKDIKYLITTAK